jgi:hypothetical protein
LGRYSFFTILATASEQAIPYNRITASARIEKRPDIASANAEKKYNPEK